MKVRCVYAGTLDPLKGGAARAVALSRYLGERYEVHILGFGSAPDLDSLRRQISELPCPDRVILHSPLEGQEFLNFLGSCDIGLSTQSTADAFNESSFPSKILSYLGAGLPVVSVPAPAVVSSQVSHAISIAESDDPRDLALAIRSLAQDTRARSPEETLARLDIDFEHSLRQVVMDAKGAQV